MRNVKIHSISDKLIQIIWPHKTSFLTTQQRKTKENVSCYSQFLKNVKFSFAHLFVTNTAGTKIVKLNVKKKKKCIDQDQHENEICETLWRKFSLVFCPYILIPNWWHQAYVHKYFNPKIRNSYDSLPLNVSSLHKDEIKQN